MGMAFAIARRSARHARLTKPPKKRQRFVFLVGMDTTIQSQRGPAQNAWIIARNAWMANRVFNVPMDPIRMKRPLCALNAMKIVGHALGQMRIIALVARTESF